MGEKFEWSDSITGIYYYFLGSEASNGSSEESRLEIPKLSESENGFGYIIETNRIGIPNGAPSNMVFTIETDGYGTYKATVPNDERGI
ncbi:hypothetical protein [Planococcus ruber]|uniref:hypothetical protein n=1 Tax=Planococcus ruber TaxID=2027871 RepID=UPI001FEF0ED0|nr:hypothetical protein [Planococcus ruber]MCJ1908242.1 hypothetical protein [Planococcus ruber]